MRRWLGLGLLLLSVILGLWWLLREPMAVQADIEEVLVSVRTQEEQWPGGFPVPLVGFELCLRVPTNASLDFTIAGCTDAAGVGSVALPWSKLAAAQQTRGETFFARVKGVGHMEKRRYLQIPEEPGTLQVILVAMFGRSIQGRLLSADGQGVAGKVRATRPTGEPSESLYLASSRVPSHGFFSVDVDEEGLWDVYGESPSHGTAVEVDVAVDFRHTVRDVDLQLIGPGVLRGRVLDSAGQPVAEFELLTTLAELDNDQGDRFVRGIRTQELELEGCGNLWSLGRTRKDGRFIFRGLRADNYVIRARTDRSSQFPVLLTRFPVAATGEELILRMDRPGIVVSVLDADGAPFTGELAIVGSYNQGSKMGTDAWPDKLALAVGPRADHADVDASYSQFLRGGGAGDGPWLWEARAGARYVVGLLGPGIAWEPTEVEVPIDGTAVHVQVRVPRARSTGELAIDVVDGTGLALVDQLRIRILDERSGRPLISKDWFHQQPWPQRFELPVGRYRVAIDGEPAINDHHGYLLEERAFGRFTADIEIRKDESTNVLAVLLEGARLNLILKGAVMSDDRVAATGTLAARQSRWDEDSSAEEVERWARSAEISLREDGRWPRPVHFAMFAYPHSSSSGTHLFSFLDIASEGTSEKLAAGSFELTARMPGGRRVSQRILLVDGETTTVTLTFE